MRGAGLVRAIGQTASDEWPEAESEEIEGAGTAGNIDLDD